MAIAVASAGIGFWDIIARVKSTVEEAFTGGLSDLSRAKIIAECQADVRAAGGTLADQQLCGEELNRFIDTKNKEAKRKDPLKAALKTAAFAVGLGIVTFATVKALK